jgi:hypothetical protein
MSAARDLDLSEVLRARSESALPSDLAVVVVVVCVPRFLFTI